MKKLVDAYFFLLKMLVAGLLLLMVVLVFGNVVLRYGFNSGIIVSEELSRWCFIWLIFLSAIVALRDNQHLGFDTVFRKFPARVQRMVEVGSICLMLYATWLIISGSLTLVDINKSTVAPATNLSLTYFYSSGVVFGLSTALVLLARLLRVVTGKTQGQR